MSNKTISSGQSYTLSSALTSGTNIEFVGVVGTLTIEPAAVTATGLGGTIGNFRPGDFLTIDNAQEIITDLGYPGDARPPSVHIFAESWTSTSPHFQPPLTDSLFEFAGPGRRLASRRCHQPARAFWRGN